MASRQLVVNRFMAPVSGACVVGNAYYYILFGSNTLLYLFNSEEAVGQWAMGQWVTFRSHRTTGHGSLYVD